MNKFLNSSKLNYIIVYVFGAVATFSNSPFSIYPLFFTIGFGIYLINYSKNFYRLIPEGFNIDEITHNTKADPNLISVDNVLNKIQSLKN